MSRLSDSPETSADTDVRTRDCARFNLTGGSGLASRIDCGVLGWIWAIEWGGGWRFEVKHVYLPVVVEMAAGAREFGVLLVGAQGDGLFAVDPLGSA